MEEKRFEEWIRLKESMHYNEKMPIIKEREVWWCSVGENVGKEINGKNHSFTRPVLIVRKLSRYGFIGVPLTSKEHSGSWYAKFDFLGRTQYAAICQIRFFSVFRLYERMGSVPESDLKIIKEAMRKLFIE